MRSSRIFLLIITGLYSAQANKLFKVVKRIRGSSGSSSNEDLSSAVPSYKIEDFSPLYHFPKVPSFIIKYTKDIESLAVDHKSIYRVPGRKIVYDALVDTYLRTHKIDMEMYGINDLASAVKRFLSILDEPLLTFGLQEIFLRLAKRGDKFRIQEAIKKLPTPNRDTLAYMIIHLHTIVAAGNLGNQGIENLAISFGEAFYRIDVGASLDTINNPNKVNLALLSIDTEFYIKMLQLTFTDELFSTSSANSANYEQTVTQTIM
ncbi:Rac GTPase-activating protein 1 [Thelohanellus kitauei]|uniref:Rac GTPase-activating protein 1 n=1 Tax=Thelohanellus kitauei TaxID=669202 RepID=A0A0C2ILA0_THEKT|nr:Rac GTPase-activating protein 1 [Thelohanellus kitauei]